MELDSIKQIIQDFFFSGKYFDICWFRPLCCRRNSWNVCIV